MSFIEMYTVGLGWSSTTNILQTQCVYQSLSLSLAALNKQQFEKQRDYVMATLDSFLLAC